MIGDLLARPRAHPEAGASAHREPMDGRGEIMVGQLRPRALSAREKTLTIVHDSDGAVFPLRCDRPRI